MNYGGEVDIFYLEYSNLCWGFSITFLAVLQFVNSVRAIVRPCVSNLVRTLASAFCVRFKPNVYTKCQYTKWPIYVWTISKSNLKTIIFRHVGSYAPFECRTVWQCCLHANKRTLKVPKRYMWSVDQLKTHSDKFIHKQHLLLLSFLQSRFSNKFSKLLYKF